MGPRPSAIVSLSSNLLREASNSACETYPFVKSLNPDGASTAPGAVCRTENALAVRTASTMSVFADTGSFALGSRRLGVQHSRAVLHAESRTGNQVQLSTGNFRKATLRVDAA